MMNTLADLGFALFHVDDRHAVHPDTTPGTWGHLATYAPPWIAFWMRYDPDA